MTHHVIGGFATENGWVLVHRPERGSSMDHNTDGVGCLCIPRVIPVERPDGSIGRVIAHREPGQTPEQVADRKARIAEAIEQVRNDTEREGQP